MPGSRGAVEAAPPDARLDEARAWACLLTNLLVLPGLGSIIAGRRSGWPQAAIALAGFALTTVWLVWFLAAWLRGGEFPLDPGPYLPAGALGVVVFAVSWVWSLLTGLLIVRAARARVFDTPPPRA